MRLTPSFDAKKSAQIQKAANAENPTRATIREMTGRLLSSMVSE
jgi:hypothetical protein